MLGVVGCLVPEIIGYADWVQAPTWAVTGGKATYLGVEIPFDLKTLALIVRFHFSEDIKNRIWFRKFSQLGEPRQRGARSRIPRRGSTRAGPSIHWDSEKTRNP